MYLIATNQGLFKLSEKLERITEKYRVPPLSLILYAESKYMVSERDVKVPELPIGKEVQFSVGEMLAKYFGGELYYSPIEIVKREKTNMGI